MDNKPMPIPSLPVIEGLHFRNPNGEQDTPALTAVQAGRAERDAIDPHSIVESHASSEKVRQALAKAAEARQLDRWLLAELNGQVVAYATIESWHEEDERWVYLSLGWVVPAYRGLGIGTALLRWGEQEARRLAASEHPGELFELAGNASNSEPEAAELLLHEGYTVAFTDLEMAMDLSLPLVEAPLPPGIEVRPALPEHIPLIGESIAEAYRGEFPGDRYRDTLVEAAGQTEWYSDPVHDLSLWQVAWEGEQVAGQVLPMLEGGQAVIDEVSVRPAWRRRGLARALLIRALLALRKRGLPDARLFTGASFPTRARDLYTSLGFKVVKEFPRYRKAAY
jgi:mycothiol synthase